jgi:mRNA interferase HicA
MKRLDLVKAIERLGCVLIRHGSRHDWYHNPLTGVSQPVPRHREIKEHMAKRIIKALSNPANGGGAPADDPGSPS